jgi:hypothetical protein
MQHCLVCPLLPNQCSSNDLAVFNTNPKDWVKKWETSYNQPASKTRKEEESSHI